MLFIIVRRPADFSRTMMFCHDNADQTANARVILVVPQDELLSGLMVMSCLWEVGRAVGGGFYRKAGPRPLATSEAVLRPRWRWSGSISWREGCPRETGSGTVV